MPGLWLNDLTDMLGKGFSEPILTRYLTENGIRANAVNLLTDILMGLFDAILAVYTRYSTWHFLLAGFPEIAHMGTGALLVMSAN